MLTIADAPSGERIAAVSAMPERGEGGGAEQQRGDERPEPVRNTA